MLLRSNSFPFDYKCWTRARLNNLVAVCRARARAIRAHNFHVISCPASPGSAARLNLHAPAAGHLHAQLTRRVPAELAVGRRRPARRVGREGAGRRRPRPARRRLRQGRGGKGVCCGEVLELGGQRKVGPRKKAAAHLDVGRIGPPRISLN